MAALSGRETCSWSLALQWCRTYACSKAMLWQGGRKSLESSYVGLASARDAPSTLDGLQGCAGVQLACRPLRGLVRANAPGHSAACEGCAELCSAAGDCIIVCLPAAHRYELHHGVRIADSALVDAAVLSDRYIADRYLPDKVRARPGQPIENQRDFSLALHACLSLCLCEKRR